jgi:hypothetical protein
VAGASPKVVLKAERIVGLSDSCVNRGGRGVFRNGELGKEGAMCGNNKALFNESNKRPLHHMTLCG